MLFNSQGRGIHYIVQDTIVEYRVDKDDLIYRYTCDRTNFKCSPKNVVRTFQYSDNKLVDTGIKCKWDVDKTFTKVQSFV